MKLKVLRETSTELTVTIQNAKLNTVNRLRKILLTGIKTPSFRWVEILENITSIHEESLANRLMMVPINGPYTDPEDIPVTFRLSKKLNTNLNTKVLQPYIVTTNDLIPKGEKAEFYKIEPNVIILPLQPGESIEIILYIDSSTSNEAKGENESTCCPVITCSYRKKGKDWLFEIECPSVFNCRELMERGLKKLDVKYQFIR